MLIIKGLPIQEKGNLALPEDDLNFLQRTPPTEASLMRATEIGVYLGELLAANRTISSGILAAYHLTQEPQLPAVVARELWDSSDTAYNSALQREQDLRRAALKAYYEERTTSQ